MTIFLSEVTKSDFGKTAHKSLTHYNISYIFISYDFISLKRILNKLSFGTKIYSLSLIEVYGHLKMA